MAVSEADKCLPYRCNSGGLVFEEFQQCRNKNSLCRLVQCKFPQSRAYQASPTNALNQMSVQAGRVYSSYIYRDDDKPLYRRGNTSLLWINLLSIAVFLLTKIYYMWRNKQKERAWNSLTEEQQVEYRKTTKLQGSRRLDFRFAH